MRYLILSLALAFAPAASADNPAIRLPAAPPAPKVEPPATKTEPGVLTLKAGARYVVAAKVKCDLITFPDGLVEVEEKTGPRDWTAVFADGTGEPEDRNFPEPFLYALKAKPGASGTLTLYVIPQGYKSRNEWKVATVNVQGGQGPIPPPKPKPDPPKPDPPKPEPVTSFRVLFVVERMGNLTAAQNSVVHGVEVERFLEAKTMRTDGGRGWRRIDKDAPTDGDTPTMNALWRQTKPKLTAVPCVAVEVNGKVDIIPLEATPAAMVAKFKEYIGEK